MLPTPNTNEPQTNHKPTKFDGVHERKWLKRFGLWKGSNDDQKKGILSVGQAAAFATAVQPVEEIVDQLMAEAAEAERRLAGAAAAE